MLLTTFLPTDRVWIFSEDMTEKTDYDVIFGSDNRVSLLPTAGGEPRVLIETVKGNYSGPQLTWSRQHRHYAYAEKGKIYFGSRTRKEYPRR